MKKKYIVKEVNGWYYGGKYYLEGSEIELSQGDFDALGGAVKLEEKKEKIGG